MVFLLHVGRLLFAISRFVSRNRILCEATFKSLLSYEAISKVAQLFSEVIFNVKLCLIFSLNIRPIAIMSWCVVSARTD